MDENEASAILQEHVQKYRAMPHGELRRLVQDEEHIEMSGPSGAEYQIEAQGVWDEGREGGNMRVMVSIDDGRGLRQFVPKTDSFIVAPDGSFVGE
ncbi:MAG: hypothetical protein WD379_10075 [Dehalococcoidia bacterium]